jgi:hypothetical protein
MAPITIPSTLLPVDGRFGCGPSKVRPEQLAYLACRGLSEADVEALFSRAIFDDALIAAATKEAQDAVLTRAEEVLGPDIAHDIVESLSIG